MAKTGFSDSVPLLDLQKKTEERRAPLRTWTNACPPRERWQPVDGPPNRRAHRKRITVQAPRLPVSTDDGIIAGFREDDGPSPRADGSAEEAVLLYLHGLQTHPTLQQMPGLLRQELELAMLNLGLIYDRTYAWDIFTDMTRGQFRHTFPNTDLPKPFTFVTRAIVVDWLIQVHEVLNFSEETLYLSVHLFNRAIQQIKVSTSRLQLLGTCCLFLAAKKEECLLPEVSELCFLMENSYTKRQLLRMERQVLCELEYDLSHSCPLQFLLLYATVAHCSEKMVWMARYLLELSLLEVQCMMFLPGHLASAALCLARMVLQEPPNPEGETAWCIASSINMGSETALLNVMNILAGAAALAHRRETNATFRKFNTPKTMHVSCHPALQSAPCLLGLPSAPT